MIFSRPDPNPNFKKIHFWQFSIIFFEVFPFINIFSFYKLLCLASGIRVLKLVTDSKKFEKPDPGKHTGSDRIQEKKPDPTGSGQKHRI